MAQSGLSLGALAKAAGTTPESLQKNAQARLMAACSHGANLGICPPMSVAREFNQADKRSGILRKKKRKKNK